MNDLRALQRLINDFAAVERSHYLPRTTKKESDIHHSYSVALLAWYIHDALHLDLDIGKILSYALVHDLVEVYAGDVSAYADEDEKIHKQKAEAASLIRLRQEFAQTFPGLIQAIEAYESKSSPEARFVWTIDKAQAMVQGREDNYRPFYEQGITSSDVQRVHGAHGEAAYEPVKDYYRQVLQEFLREYDDARINHAGTIRVVSAPSRASNNAD